MVTDSSEIKKNSHMPGVDTPSVKVVNHFDRCIPISPRKYQSHISSLYATLGKYDIDRFDVEVNPVSVITVDPSEIVDNTGRMWKPWDNRRQLVGRVMDGDWHSSDPKDVPDYAKPYPKKFTEMVEYKSFRDHFLYDEPWENTSLYDRWMSNSRSDNNSPYSGRSDVEDRLQYMDKLFKEIKTNGYKSQLELADKNVGYLDAILNEVNVDISPTGEPLFVDGRHRLCIAKLLNIDKIPAFVLVRHRCWVEKSCNFSVDSQ